MLVASSRNWMTSTGAGPSASVAVGSVVVVGQPLKIGLFTPSATTLVQSPPALMAIAVRRVPPRSNSSVTRAPSPSQAPMLGLDTGTSNSPAVSSNCTTSTKMCSPASLAASTCRRSTHPSAARSSSVASARKPLGARLNSSSASSSSAGEEASTVSSSGLLNPSRPTSAKSTRSQPSGGTGRSPDSFRHGLDADWLVLDGLGWVRSPLPLEHPATTTVANSSAQCIRPVHQAGPPGGAQERRARADPRKRSHAETSNRSRGCSSWHASRAAEARSAASTRPPGGRQTGRRHDLRLARLTTRAFAPEARTGTRRRRRCRAPRGSARTR